MHYTTPDEYIIYPRQNHHLLTKFPIGTKIDQGEVVHEQVTKKDSRPRWAGQRQGLLALVL